MPNLPPHWRVLRLAALFREVAEPGQVDLPILSVSFHSGISDRELDDEDRVRSVVYIEDKTAYKRVRPGDLVYNMMRAWQGAFGIAAIDGLVSPAYVVARPRTEFSLSYFEYMIRSGPCVEEMRLESRGIVDFRLRLYWEHFRRIRVALPPLLEQHTIAAFLDGETARIDALIAKKRRLIKLLREKRQAVISHAVTKGLDPNAPMKDSGIEWLGDIPEHWQVKQLRYLTRPGTSITYGIVQAGPHVEDGIPYIRTSDMAGESLPEEGYLRTSPDIDAMYSRSKVRAGDLVIAIRATVGKTLPVPTYLDGANLTQGTAKVSLRDGASRDFMLFVLNSTNSSSGFMSMAKGATFKEITLEMLRKFTVPFPPTQEQSAIAESLSTHLRPVYAAINMAETAVAKLDEHRAALIAAAVTGKIDVRPVALAAEPEVAA
jgi:type I restriction enzyme, S subunit